MPGWRVRESLDASFGGVGRIVVRSTDGSVTVRSGRGPVRCEIRDVVGGPVEVVRDGGTLRVLHPNPGFCGWDDEPRRVGAESAAIELTVPAGIELDVTSERGEVSWVGDAVVRRHAS